jgi:CheY-like chemotaxis protein
MDGNGTRSGASPETRRVIHELRQPLAAVQVWLELLAESLQGQLSEQQERYLSKVRAEVLRIGTVLAASAASPAADPGGGGAPATAPPPLAAARDERTSDPLPERSVDPARESASGALAGLSLLVVEDDEMTAEALQLALEGEGALVAVAATIADGLTRFRETSPDAVLSDLRVSDGDGFTLVSDIRESERASGRRTIAVAVTGYDSRETRAAARAAGFDETVTKPFAIDHLVATVARLVAAR